MSVFSSSVKSTIIDPVFTSASRCEFRLANRGEAYMPTMRIGNLGLTNTGKNNQYHFGVGAASVIDRIQLLDKCQSAEPASDTAAKTSKYSHYKRSTENTWKDQ